MFELIALLIGGYVVYHVVAGWFATQATAYEEQALADRAQHGANAANSAGCAGGALLGLAALPVLLLLLLLLTGAFVHVIQDDVDAYRQQRYESVVPR